MNIYTIYYLILYTRLFVDGNGEHRIALVIVIFDFLIGSPPYYSTKME